MTVDIFTANNHGNQKYSELYRNDFNTWLKVLGIVSNEIYRYYPSLIMSTIMRFIICLCRDLCPCGGQYPYMAWKGGFQQSFEPPFDTKLS